MAYLKYTTLDALKAYLPNTSLTDDQLNALITRASNLLDSELGDNIGLQTITKRMDGYGKPKLVMENRVVSVESVSYCVRQTRYPVTVSHINGVIVYLEEPLPVGEQNVQITYTKGYETVPEDVQIFFHMYSMKLLSLDRSSLLSLMTTTPCCILRMSNRYRSNLFDQISYRFIGCKMY